MTFLYKNTPSRRDVLECTAGPSTSHYGRTKFYLNEYLVVTLPFSFPFMTTYPPNNTNIRSAFLEVFMLSKEIYIYAKPINRSKCQRDWCVLRAK